MLSRPNVHYSCWLRTCKVTGVHLNPGGFAKYTGYLIPAQDHIVISYANIADFSTLIHIFMCTQSCFEKETCIHLCINMCLYYIFKKIYMYTYGTILSCLMSGEVSWCGWWQLCWSVNRMYVIHSFVIGARVVTSWLKYNRCCMRLRVRRVVMILIMSEGGGGGQRWCAESLIFCTYAIRNA
jgi:hypothetical protein